MSHYVKKNASTPAYLIHPRDRLQFFVNNTYTDLLTLGGVEACKFDNPLVFIWFECHDFFPL
jgi:hypothetical protein